VVDLVLNVPAYFLDAPAWVLVIATTGEILWPPVGRNGFGERDKLHTAA
jgi:hypothetical protein